MSPITEDSPEPGECEQGVILKLIKIVEVALKSSNQNNYTGLGQSEQAFAKKFIEILVKQNESVLGSGEVFDGDSLNVTNMIQLSDISGKTGVTTGDGRSLHRLQHLEMIKVGVLIFVISIIMLTTCRMVFQLFVRFRPEKPQMH